MTDKSDDNKSGYGLPPRNHQFQKGRSGNPKGRPKGARNKRPGGGLNKLIEIVQKDASRGVKINEGDKRVTLSMFEAVLKAIGVKAVKGSVPAQRLYVETVFETEGLADRRHTLMLDTVLEHKLGWQRKFEEFDDAGIERPDVFPHPDDVHIDPETGEVLILGPLTKEQRDRENENLRSVYKKELAAHKAELRKLEEHLNADGSQEDLDITKHDIAKTKSVIKRFQKTLRTLKGRFRIKTLLSPNSTGNVFEIEHY